MPLPPAPTQRASRLTHKAFDNPLDDHDSAATEATDKPVPQPQASISKRASRPSKATPVRETAQADAAPQAAAPSARINAHEKTKPTRNKRATGPTKLFVLDTNVLMHDPMSLFRFEEHDVFLPMIVLEELDGHKKGMTEVARNARQASRSLDSLAAAQGADMGQGLPLSTTGFTEATGKLFFQTQPLDLRLPMALPQGKADNQILGVVSALVQMHSPREVVLVSLSLIHI